MGKIKFFVFTDIDNDHRLIRFQEECDKRNDLELVPINMRKMIITESDVYNEKREKIDFSNSIVWSLSNLTTTHCLARILEEKNVLCWPNKESLIFADKFYSSLIFSKLNIPSPKAVFINSYKNLDNLASFVGGFPCVIKKTVGSMGMFVEIVKNKKEAKKFIKKTFKRAKKSKLTFNRIRFLLQEYVKEIDGVDYRVLCANGEILGVIRRKADKGFKSNISLGGKAIKVSPDRRIREYSEKLIKDKNLFYAGIDFVKKGEDYMILEINTSAQFQGFESATKINVAGKIIDKLLEKRLNTNMRK